MNEPASNDAPQSQPSRVVIGNALEWNQQPERRGLPGNKVPAVDQPYPDDDMMLFLSGDNKIVVTRQSIDPQHVDDCRSILGYKDVVCMTPLSGARSHSICTDIASDEQSLGDLAERIEALESGPVLAEAYGATPEWARLLSALRERAGCELDDQMTPPQSLEFITCLDSKIRVREFFAAAISAGRQLRLTRAFTVRSGSDLREYVKGAVRVLGPVIVKADYGFGGHAMRVVDSIESLSDQIGCFLPAGHSSDLLIEEYVGSGDSVMPLCYTGVAGQNGEVTNSSLGRELQYSTRFYAGAHIGAGSVPPEYTDSALQVGEAVGRIISLFGFRGSFTLDLLCRKDDASLFLLEINPRRALPSALGDMCLQLFGPHYERTVSAVARRWIPVHPSVTGYGRFRDLLAGKDLFGRVAEGLVILPYMVSQLPVSSAVGIAVMGTGSDDVEAAVGEVTRYLAEG